MVDPFRLILFATCGRRVLQIDRAAQLGGRLGWLIPLNQRVGESVLGKTLQTILQEHGGARSTLATPESLSGNADTFFVARLSFVVVAVERTFTLFRHRLGNSRYPRPGCIS